MTRSVTHVWAEGVRHGMHAYRPNRVREVELEKSKPKSEAIEDAYTTGYRVGWMLAQIEEEKAR